MDLKEFRQFATRLHPLPADAKELAKRNHDLTMRELEYLFAQAPTQEPIRNTRWAACNAVTERLDHKSPVFGSRDIATVRAERALLDDHDNAKLKARAFRLLATV